MKTLTPQFIYSVCMESADVDLSSENNNLDEQKLLAILDKYEMTEYTELFLRDKKFTKYKIDSPIHYEDFNKRKKKEILRTLELLEIALLLVKSRDGKYGIDITFKNVKDESKSINHASITSAVEDKILELLFNKRIGLNISNDILEVAKIVNSKTSKKIIYEEKDKRVYFENPKLRLSLYREYFSGLKLKSEVTEEYLRNQISEYKLDLSKIQLRKGAESKNLYVGIAAINLSYLIRFKGFVAQTKVDDIRKFKLDNNSKRFIYEIMALIGLIQEEQIIDHNFSDPNGTTNKPKFIQSLINQRYEKSSKSIFIYDQYNPDERINKVWKKINSKNS